MRTFFRPLKSDAHRIACLSLYRALLQRCDAIGSLSCNHALTHTLRSLVRYRFRNDRAIISPSRIANGLRFGHNVLDLLDEGSRGSSAAISRLTEIIGNVASTAQATSARRQELAAARSATNPAKMRKLEHIQQRSTKANQTRRPDNPPILQRPLPISEISGGRRRVPYLITKAKIPFLRYPGLPQPPALSRVIRQLNDRHDKLWLQKKTIEETMVFAQDEDTWDTLLASQGVTDRHSRRSWTKSLHDALQENTTKIKQMDMASTDMGHRMWDVVVKERELAKQEEQERGEHKFVKKSQRKQTESASNTTGNDTLRT